MSGIEWTEETCNPILGCRTPKVSAGCAHCYAERMAKRLKVMGQPQYQDVIDGNGWTGRMVFHEPALKRFDRKAPTMFFVGSMTDMWAPGVNPEWRAKIFAAMLKNPQHVYQVLSKRYGNMRDDLLWSWHDSDNEKHIYFGFSVCDQRDMDNAAAHGQVIIQNNYNFFLSVEPYVSPIDFAPFLGEYDCMRCQYRGDLTGIDYCDRCDEEFGDGPDSECQHCGWGAYISACPECGETDSFGHAANNPELKQVSGVIVGGESGPGARPMHPEWARSIRDQCVEAGVPFFFKQWGAWADAATFDASWENLPEGVVKGARWLAPDGQQWRSPQKYPDAVERRARNIELMMKLGKQNTGRKLGGRLHNDLPWGQLLEMEDNNA